MARVFLDTNIYIDIVHRKPEVIKTLESSRLFFSPLSTHILFYAFKIKVPSKKIAKITSSFGAVPLTRHILDKSFDGPTNDLEDNIQLHSAIESECQYFLTNDKKLLKMKFFGKMRIVDTLAPESGPNQK